MGETILGYCSSKTGWQLLNLLTLGLWSKVGRLTHYAFDAVLSKSNHDTPAWLARRELKVLAW